VWQRRNAVPVPSQRVGGAQGGAGLCLVMHGHLEAARPLVERWAQTIGKGVIIDSTVGLLDDSPFRTCLAEAMRPEVIAVLDANLSALDIYARPISDAVIDAISRNDSGNAPAILFSLSDSVGHLPVPKSVERLPVGFDLDRRYEFQGIEIGDLMLRAFAPDEGLLATKLWGPACERLRDYVTKLDSDTQALVLPVLLST